MEKNKYQSVREDELKWSREKAVDVFSETNYTNPEGETTNFSYLNYDKLVKLEHDPTKLQPLDVVGFALAYNKPELRNHYCCHDCEIGKIDAPVVEDASNIHKILVNMAVSLESVNSQKMRLMQIIEDGIVDDNEVGDLNKILDELEKISMTVEAIQLWCQKMKICADKK